MRNKTKNNLTLVKWSDQVETHKYSMKYKFRQNLSTMVTDGTIMSGFS